MEGDRSAAEVVPSCGESGTLQGVGQDSRLGGGVGAEQGLAQSGAPERTRSHLEWGQL